MPACLTTFYPQVKDLRLNVAQKEVGLSGTDVLLRAGEPPVGKLSREPATSPQGCPQAGFGRL
jgi:hypothetical protein